MLWIGTPDCTAALSISLVDPSGKSLSDGRPCGLGRVVLRSTGACLSAYAGIRTEKCEHMKNKKGMAASSPRHARD